MFRRRVPVGAAPGTLPESSPVETAVLRLIQFSPGSASDRIVKSVPELAKALGLNKSNGSGGSVESNPESSGAVSRGSTETITWLDVDKISDTKTLAQLGELFGLHPLALEDVVNVHQHSKADVYGDTLYLVARMPLADSEGHFDTEQVSIFLKPGLVITFQEKPGDCLDGVRNRIAHGGGRIRRMPADYLTYAIFDAILDGYFPRLEQLEHQLGTMSEKLVEEPEKDTPMSLHNIRSNLLMIRKYGRQHKDAIASLLRDKSNIVTGDTALYFRDCVDHATQIVEAADIYRETCGELRELFFAGLSQKNNDVMKVLTVIATLFIPMSFVAGVYGMNFDNDKSWMNMPELEWAFGYPFALSIMALLGGGLLWFMVSKKWL
jgi:magnesium transporter